jgi:hypothetical protein
MRYAKRNMFLVLVMTALLAASALAAAGCGGNPATSETASTGVKPSSNVSSPRSTGVSDKASTATAKKPVSTAPAAQQTDEVSAVDQAAIKAAQANNPSLTDLKVLSTKLVNDWALVVLQPPDKSIDAAAFLMQNQGGKWVAIDFGTSIEPQDHPDAPPELFQ